MNGGMAHQTAGVGLPAGARVLVIYASANRDEREPQRKGQVT
jgi:cytochrome P450